MLGKIVVLIFTVLISNILTETEYYDSYYAYKLTSAQYQAYVANGTNLNCTNIVQTCNASEPRRGDGTCNNLNSPPSGASRTPYYRLLPANYSANFEPRFSVSGAKLTDARIVRTTLFDEGVVLDQVFNPLATHVLVFAATDITNTRDTTNYVTWRPYCCDAAGLRDNICTPQAVPADDRTHRFSGIRCLNMTRPLTYQTSGCLPNTTTPLRIVDATPVFDLSPVYGDVTQPTRRQNRSGLLVTEVTSDGAVFPPTTGIGLLLGVNFFGILWYWNFHNHIATQLAKVNPSWDDDKLFSVAREINIAMASQIYYYELTPLLMGRDDLIKDGIISNSTGFRDIYDSSLLPQISLEYPAVLRWLHVMQEGSMRMYDNNGNYLKKFPITNLTGNIDYLKTDGNMASITQGCFRTGCGKVNDYTVDPDIVQWGLGVSQRASDIMTNDLAKHRYFGFPPYVEYRKLCFNETITSFDDMAHNFPADRLELMKQVYDSSRDVDLLAGIWMELLKKDAYVPPTFYCIISRQLLRSVKSDRHWYERANRPNAFTLDQLLQVRNITMARVMCDIGTGVNRIQPSAFTRISATNPLTNCTQIKNIDWSVWAQK